MTNPTTDDVAHLRPYWPGTAWVDVLPLGGFTVGGLHSDPNAGTRKIKVTYASGEVEEVDVPHEYAPVLARVLRTHGCEEIVPGDVVRFIPQQWERHAVNGKDIFVMHESSMLAVLDGFDEAGLRLTENVTQ